ncbi:MAG: hypothetical protein ABL932_23255 [Terricaulis sp.]
MNVRSIVAALALAFLASAATAQAPTPVNQAAIAAERPPELLSAYHFFRDPGASAPRWAPPARLPGA